MNLEPEGKNINPLLKRHMAIADDTTTAFSRRRVDGEAFTSEPLTTDSHTPVNQMADPEGPAMSFVAADIKTASDADDEKASYVSDSTLNRGKGKARATYVPELPDDVWKRVFELYLDDCAEDWHNSNRYRGAIKPLLLCKGLTCLALPVLYCHPMVSYSSIPAFLQSLMLPSPYTLVPKASHVRHLTIQPSPTAPSLEFSQQPYKDYRAQHPGAEPLTIHASLPHVMRHFPKLHTLHLKEALVLHEADAKVLFGSLALTRPEKARLELRMWDLYDSPIGDLFMAVNRPSIHHPATTRFGGPRQLNGTLQSRRVQQYPAGNVPFLQEAWSDALLYGGEVDLPSEWLEPRHEPPPAHPGTTIPHFPMFSLGNVSMADPAEGLAPRSAHVGHPSAAPDESSIFPILATDNSYLHTEEPPALVSLLGIPAIAHQPSIVDLNYSPTDNATSHRPLRTLLSAGRPAQPVSKAELRAESPVSVPMAQAVRNHSTRAHPANTPQSEDIAAAASMLISASNDTAAEAISPVPSSKSGWYIPPTLTPNLENITSLSGVSRAADLPAPGSSNPPSVTGGLHVPPCIESPPADLAAGGETVNSGSSLETSWDTPRDLTEPTIVPASTSQAAMGPTGLPHRLPPVHGQVRRRYSGRSPAMLYANAEIETQMTRAPGIIGFSLSHLTRLFLLDLVKRSWSPRLHALSLVALDPLASLIVRAPEIDLWIQMPVEHIRVHLPRGCNPLAVFKGTKESINDRVRRQRQPHAVNTVAEANMGNLGSHTPQSHLFSQLQSQDEHRRIVGGDGMGGGLLHSAIKLFEIEVNTLAEMHDDVWIKFGDQLPPEVCRILAGEHDWRDLKIGPSVLSHYAETQESPMPNLYWTAREGSPTFSFVSIDEDDTTDEDGERELGFESEEGETYDAQAAADQRRRMAERVERWAAVTTTTTTATTMAAAARV